MPGMGGRKRADNEKDDIYDDGGDDTYDEDGYSDDDDDQRANRDAFTTSPFHGRAWICTRARRRPPVFAHAILHGRQVLSAPLSARSPSCKPRGRPSMIKVFLCCPGMWSAASGVWSILRAREQQKDIRRNTVKYKK